MKRDFKDLSMEEWCIKTFEKKKEGKIMKNLKIFANMKTLDEKAVNQVNTLAEMAYYDALIFNPFKK